MCAIWCRAYIRAFLLKTAACCDWKNNIDEQWEWIKTVNFKLPHFFPPQFMHSLSLRKPDVTRQYSTLVFFLSRQLHSEGFFNFCTLQTSVPWIFWNSFILFFCIWSPFCIVYCVTQDWKCKYLKEESEERLKGTQKKCSSLFYKKINSLIWGGVDGKLLRCLGGDRKLIPKANPRT